jgi:hypothetical protein
MRKIHPLRLLVLLGIGALNLAGITFSDIMDHVAALKEKFQDPGDDFYYIHKKMEGVESVFNSVDNGQSLDNKLWLMVGLIPENMLTLYHCFHFRSTATQPITAACV